MKIIKRDESDFIWVTGNRRFLFFQKNYSIYLGGDISRQKILFFRQFNGKKHVEICLFFNSKEESEEVMEIFKNSGFGAEISHIPISKYSKKNKYWVTEENINIVLEQMSNSTCFLIDVSGICFDNYEKFLEVFISLRELGYKTFYYCINKCSHRIII